MNILQINLKHLYQRINYRLFWLGFIGGIIAIIAVVLHGGKGAFEGVLIWTYLFGLLTASMPVEILTKPFAFCLPGHNAIPRKFLFTVCLTMSFFIMVIFLLYPATNLTAVVLTSVSTALAGTIFYWLGAWIVFGFANWISTLAILSLLVFSEGLNIPLIIKHIIVNEWLFVIFAGILVNILAYLHWGKSDLAKKYCGRMWMGAFDAWDRKKLSKYTEARLAEKQKNLPVYIKPKIETFFINQISRSGDNLSRYVWGGLYKSLAVMLSCRNNWFGALIGFLLMLLFMGYIGTGGNIIFILPVFIVLQASLHVHSPLLISGGRRERFWTALALGTAATLLITAFLILAALITLWLEPIMPALTLNGRHFDFKAIDLNLSFLSLFVVPVAFAVGLIFEKKPMMKMIVVMLVFQVIFIFLILNHSNQRFIFTPVKITALLLCSWAVFVSVLRYICMKCSLV